MLIDICLKFREDSLRGFQVTERTRFVTDRRTDALGKTMRLPTLKRGDIMTSNNPLVTQILQILMQKHLVKFHPLLLEILIIGETKI